MRRVVTAVLLLVGTASVVFLAAVLRQKGLPPGHPDLATSLNNIALVYKDRGEHAQALHYHERALDSLRLPGPAGLPVPLDRLPPGQLRPDPTTLKVARDRARLLYATLPPAAGRDALRACVRAFLAAGSRGVVCSLWRVEDRQTARLMTDLYGGLQGGRPAGEALGDAKRRMIQAGQAPLYWAPFVLLGE